MRNASSNHATEQEVDDEILYYAHLLGEASKKGDVVEVESLIEKLGQKNLDLTDDYSISPLMYAAQNGHDNVVRILINAGADVDMGDQYDDFPWKRNAAENGTALMRAAGNGQALIVDTLIKAGANVDGNDKYGTALMRAAKNGHKEVFNILIEKGAKVDAVDKFDYNCLMRAAVNGHDELVKLSLLKGANVNSASKENKKSALMLAAKNGHDNVVKTLLFAKANVNELSRAGKTALDYATENGHDNVVKTLLNVAQSHAKTNTSTPPFPPDQSIKPSTEIAGCFSCIRIAVAKMLGSNSEITRP